METVHVALDFWKEHGLKALVVKSRHKLQGIDNDYDYGEWYELTKPTDEELAAQRQENFDFEPLLSVVIPAYKTPRRRRCRSVLKTWNCLNGNINGAFRHGT